MKKKIFFFVTLLRDGFFIRSSPLVVANFVRLGILICCLVSARSQYLVRLLSLCWTTGGHIIHPPIKGLLPLTGIEPTSFQNSASKVAGIQVHATTSRYLGKLCHKPTDIQRYQPYIHPVIRITEII